MPRLPLLRPQRFATRLIVGLLVLVVMTTLSAGVPAYWLTRTQLERQAWTHVANTQQATLSLLHAEQIRLLDLVALFAERPTLLRLAQAPDSAELPPYLDAFRDQSDLDILLLCRDGAPLVGVPAGAAVPAACRPSGSAGYEMVAGRPALVAALAVGDGDSAEATPLIAVAVSWIDDPFMQSLAAATGVQQRLLTLDGRPLAGSAPGDPAPPVDTTAGQHIVTLGGNTFYAAYAPLGAGTPALVAEVALPVDELLDTETRASLIMAASIATSAAVAVLLGIWYVRQLNAPLNRLTAVAERISQGHLLTPVPELSGPVEVTTLAAALRESQARMLQALDERSEARDWLNHLIQSIVEGVVTLDRAGRVTFLSQGAERLLGWDSADALGRSLNDLLPATDGERFLDQIPPPGLRRQIVTAHRSGRRMVLAVTGARLAPPQGNAQQVALVLRDVTEDEALRHLRSYFLANISHEFRTPLSTLNASLELLLDETEALAADEMRQLLKPTQLSLMGLQTLIDNLLESSRIEAGEFAIRYRSAELPQLITDALRVVRPLLDRRRQTLTVDCPADLPPLWGDPPRLTQVLTNLLNNAGKFSPIGAPVALHAAVHDAMLRVTVADRGPGVPAAESERIFRHFVQLDSADGEQYGIGLGLYVVKTTIEAHGGRVGVANRPDGGAAFWFELPLTGPGQHTTG